MGKEGLRMRRELYRLELWEAAEIILHSMYRERSVTVAHSNEIIVKIQMNHESTKYK